MRSSTFAVSLDSARSTWRPMTADAGTTTSTYRGAGGGSGIRVGAAAASGVTAALVASRVGADDGCGFESARRPVSSTGPSWRAGAAGAALGRTATDLDAGAGGT